jgi:hypothetical protein
VEFYGSMSPGPMYKPKTPPFKHQGTAFAHYAWGTPEEEHRHIAGANMQNPGKNVDISVRCFFLSVKGLGFGVRVDITVI